MTSHSMYVYYTLDRALYSQQTTTMQRARKIYHTDAPALARHDVFATIVTLEAELDGERAEEGDALWRRTRHQLPRAQQLVRRERL